MLPDRVSNQGPLTYESGALAITLHGPAQNFIHTATIYVLYYVETVLIAYFIRIWQLKRYIV